MSLSYKRGDTYMNRQSFGYDELHRDETPSATAATAAVDNPDNNFFLFITK